MTLNLVDVPVAVAANAIFVEILRSTVVVGDDVSGTITLQTAEPMSKQALVDTFQSVLAAKGFSVAPAGSGYRISAGLDGINTGSVSFRRQGDEVQVGTGALVVPLSSISAAEMARILAPIAPSGVLRADTVRNVLILSGNAEQIRSMQEAIRLFDVDWMRGRSVSIFPLSNGGDPTAIAKQLEEVFGGANGPAEGNVRFVPSRELGSIMVIATNPRHLDRARDFIARFDRIASANATQTFVYKVENRPAKELASIVQGMVAGEADSGVASGLNELRSSTTDGTGQEAESGLDAIAASRATSFSAGRMTVVADEPNNALIIMATRAQYDRLLPILESSDRMANQVLIEAVIAEVTLNDELRFGLRWFFENNGGKGKGLLSNAASGAVSAIAPGFSYLFANADFQVVLNALASITNVKVVSSPTLTVLDNRTARLQIGDQVPVVTQTATSTTTTINAPIVNQVEMKDTGVILSVTPRVNSNGHVLLNIEQEVSDVVRTTSSGIDSPTIRQRKVSTTVVVDDGQSIALGGLVQETKDRGTEQVPVLGDIPVLGAAFRNRKELKKRTELVIFIRPRVMRNGSEAESVTREFRDGLAQLGLGGPNETNFQRILH
ncbi:type II secretion system secretin GspD [Aureimonas sp. AU12]|uniref:type II secretion system secretin GspD n=1 Tax=Aureimonas sp. AU12 TaxID=1638161 RepID=UPI00178CB72F|nr:type II secretion system secretin GspD [Aureimonas sp. AU12]